MVATYRADTEQFERMRPEWIRRSAEISAAETRIADGVRRGTAGR